MRIPVDRRELELEAADVAVEQRLFAAAAPLPDPIARDRAAGDRERRDDDARDGQRAAAQRLARARDEAGRRPCIITARLPPLGIELGDRAVVSAQLAQLGSIEQAR